MQAATLIPSGLLLLALGLQLYHHLRFLMPFAFRDKQVKGTQKPAVSVIICARNEVENLTKNLPGILSQDYPDFEVVVVDHDSTDDTPWFLEELAKTQPRLKLTTVKDNVNFTSGKKYAQTIGIKAASHNCLVFTDADCEVRSSNWISSMVAGFEPGKEVVLGYSPYKKGFGYAGLLARYETFLTGFQYLAYAQKGVAYMGVGRNLAYTKELFFANRGFANHLHLPSGDDDLFVNEVATSTNVSVVWEKSTQMLTEPKPTFSGWFRQKRRHLSTVHLYKGRHQRMLYGLSSGRYLFWIGLGLAIGFMAFTPLILSLIAIRMLLVYVTYIKAAKKLDELDLALMWPFLEIQFLVFDLIVYLSTMAKKPKEW